ncbi:MAG: hypothetical protein GF333_01760 [Candidatus Omnitrophica bacterium]|nr:hypothetical protein [Candidatus Omnitrophota bacterium]
MSEKRKYIRIAGVLPVEFYVIDEFGKRITPWLQGFTQDIGRGGVCLCVNDLWWGFWDRFHPRGVKLVVKIDLPFRTEPLYAHAKVAWSAQRSLADFVQYRFGVEFTGAAVKNAQALFRYAVIKKTMPAAAGILLFALVAIAGFSFVQMRMAAQKNREMVGAYARTIDRLSALKDSMEEAEESGVYFARRRQAVEESIGVFEQELERLQNVYLEIRRDRAPTAREEQTRLEKQIHTLSTRLDAMQRENRFLKQKQRRRALLSEELRTEARELRQQKRQSSSRIIDGLYRWIANRQNLVSGLVLSYEGDRNLDRVCFTYDQSLAAIVFLLFDEQEKAKKIMDFYLGQVRKEGKIYNAYHTRGHVYEYVRHSGPYAWIGIAALTYVKKTGDRTYLPVAEHVAEFLWAMMDEEGGIKGGPQVDWYSTEHNLDAYAFFRMYRAIAPQARYRGAADKVKTWMSTYAYSSYGPPVKRGKGDSTIATDTYSWSLTAIGPAQLRSLQMNPERIMEFAVKNCEVETTFSFGGRQHRVRGFDFAKFRNSARGGVISCEWTAQMILAFEILADYYRERSERKYRYYYEKAERYLTELQKMIITSLSRVGREEPCFPYASAAAVDTGHGWRTPKGDRTGSLAATAYFLIAYHGYNPLTGEYLGVSFLTQDTNEIPTVREDLGDAR